MTQRVWQKPNRFLAICNENVNGNVGGVVLKIKLRISNNDTVESFRLISNYSDSGERNRRETLFNGRGDILTPGVCVWNNHVAM